MNLKLIGFVSCLVTLTLLFPVETTVYADSDRFRSGSFGKKITGAYLVREGVPKDNPTFFRLITLTADGNWLSTESHQQTVEFGFSDQQGVWKKSGRREITANVIDFDIDAVTGQPNGVTRIRFVMVFSKNFKEVSGNFFGEDFDLTQDPLNPEEIPRATFDGTFFGNRVTVEVDRDS